MTAASPAPGMSRGATVAASQAAATQAARAAVFDFSVPRGEDEIRIHLADIPRFEETMDVEGFKPTILSRLFDLFAPLKAR